MCDQPKESPNNTGRDKPAAPTRMGLTPRLPAAEDAPHLEAGWNITTRMEVMLPIPIRRLVPAEEAAAAKLRRVLGAAVAGLSTHTPGGDTRPVLTSLHPKAIITLAQ